jgi:hypothetical protein
MRLFKVWLLICIMVLSGGSLAFAQTNTFPDSGNAGIGATAPNNDLVVATNAATRGVSIWNTSASYSNKFTGIGAPRNNAEFAGGILLRSTTGGGFSIQGFTDEDDMALDFVGALGVTNPTNTTPAIGFTGYKWDGVNHVAALGSLETAFIFNNASTRIMTILGNGNVGIGTTNPTSKLHVTGDGKITGDLTVDGNIGAKYQDVAEWVRTPARLAPGTVVVIDPQENNQVLPASQAYDTRVAGVVSAQPGIILGEAGEDKAKVAHSGRVKVKADARFGSIETGDLLVSSSTSGYAMASKPVEVNGISIHRPGTIVGKALEPLKEGQGEILVLLTLQ